MDTTVPIKPCPGCGAIITAISPWCTDCFRRIPLLMRMDYSRASMKRDQMPGVLRLHRINCQNWLRRHRLHDDSLPPGGTC
jgi:hypothetical protein